MVALESSPQVAARCTALRAELRRAGGAAGAADVIEAEATAARSGTTVTAAASPSPESSKVIAARPASSRATGTRNGLQDT